jgi:hypothetical protein
LSQKFHKVILVYLFILCTQPHNNYEMTFFTYNKDIRKVRKRQHQYPGFWSYTVRFKNKTCKKLGKPSILMVPERLECCYIDFHCSYLYNYYNSSRTLCIKCWDSAAFRIEFQHFILRSNKISLLLRIPLKQGLGCERRPQDKMTLRISLIMSCKD